MVRSSSVTGGDAASATRRAIVSAARDLLCETGFHRLSLEAVAAGAGVTRATVYNHVGSKLGLLEAVLVDLGERGGMSRIGAVVAGLEPRDALSRAILQTCRFWASDRPLLRRLVGLATVDPDTASVLEMREGWRREGMSLIVDRLDGGGLLPADCTRYELMTMLVALTSFQFYDKLDDLGDDPEAAARRIDRLADALLS